MVSAQGTCQACQALQSSRTSKLKAGAPSTFRGVQFRIHRDGDTRLPAPGPPSLYRPSLRCLIHASTSLTSLLSRRFPDPAICQTTGTGAPPRHLQLHCPRPSTAPSLAGQVLLPTCRHSHHSPSDPTPSPPNRPIRHQILGIQPLLPLDLVTLSSTKVPTSVPPLLTDLLALCHVSCRPPPPPTLNLLGAFYLPQPHASHTRWHLRRPHL